MRRNLILLLAVAVLVAGCSGGGGDDGPIVASATPATLGEDARAATGYEPAGETSRTVNTSFTLSIQGDVETSATFAVAATVERRVYERPVEGGRATVGVLAEPTVKPSAALRERINPFRDRPVATLVTNATGLTVADLTHRENRTVRLLGNETALRVFDGTVRRNDGAGAVTVGIATVRDGADDVTVAVVYPRGASEAVAVEQVLAGIEHG